MFDFEGSGVLHLQSYFCRTIEGLINISENLKHKNENKTNVMGTPKIQSNQQITPITEALFTVFS